MTVTATERRQRRNLASSALVDSLGDGLFLAGSALFFTRGMGLSVAQTGFGLTVAGLLGLVAGAEIGRVADRFGPREVFVGLMTVQAAAVGGYTLVGGTASLVGFASIAAVCRQGAQAARGALIGQVGGADAPTLRAYVHAVVNAGIAGGAALAGLAVARDTHAAYVTLMLADAATFVVAAAIALALPRIPVVRSDTPRKRLALADRRFVALTGLSGLIGLQFVVSGYLLPLWVVFHTSAPKWVASPLLILNTAVIVAFQVRVSRRFRGVARAGRAYRLSGAGLFVAFCLFGAASVGHGPVRATVLLVAAMTVASAAELLTGAGGFGLSFGLAPDGAVGEYQGVWNLGFGTSIALGPGLLTVVCLDGGPAGWVALGALMVAAGGLINRIVSRSGPPTAAGPATAGDPAAATAPGAPPPAAVACRARQ